MKSIEIFCKFKSEDFQYLKEKFPLENTVFFTDSEFIKEEILKISQKIQNVSYYMGYNNENAILINEKSIKTTEEFINQFSDLTYNQISIKEILKLKVIREIRKFFWIESILKEHNNVIFLFENLTSLHFSILEFSKNMNFDSTYGITTIVKGKFIIQKFERLQKKIPMLTQKKDISHSYSEIIELDSLKNKKDSKVLFFMVNDLMNLYGKPIWNILDKLKKEKIKFTIMTNNQNTYDDIIKKELNATNIIQVLNQYLSDYKEGKLPIQETEIIKQIITKINTISTSTNLLRYYSKFFMSDSNILFISTSMLKIVLFSLFIEKIQPRVIFVTPDGTADTNLICRVAEKYQIPSYQITLTQATFTPIHTFFLTATKICISGKRAKEKLVNCGVKSTFIITGDPKYDYIPKFRKDRMKIIKNNSKSRVKKIVVATSRWNENDEIWMSELIKYCNEKKYKIVIRPHPVYSSHPSRVTEGKRKQEKIENLCKGLNFSFSIGGQLSNDLKKTDILITDFSTSGMEASLAGIPVILANIGKTTLEWGDSYTAENVVLHAESMEDLFQHIEDVLHDPIIQDRLKKARKEFSFNFNYRNDGKATQRIFKLLLSDMGRSEELISRFKNLFN